MVAASAASASSPPPPPPPSGGGGGTGGSGGGGGSTTTQPTKPARDTTAPGKVGHLRTVTNVPHRITIRWSNPGASDLAGVVVQRQWGSCPSSPRDGVRVGGTGLRTSQVDKGAVPGTAYCYAVFAFDHSGNYSRASVARHVVDKVPPPLLLPVTDLHVAATAAGHIRLSWVNPPRAGVTGIVVRRGPANLCPTGPLAGTGIGATTIRRSQVDDSSKPGATYCYRVFVLNSAGHTSVNGTGAQATAPRPSVAAHPSGAADPPASSSGSWLTSMLMRMVAAVGAAMLLVMAAATAVARRRANVSAYVAPREYAPRMAMTGVTPVTLVIPALLVLGSAAAIVLVLLNH